MAAIKFSKQSIQPNPMEVDYWVDITSNPYGGNIKYFNGYDWVDLLNAKGKPVNLDAYYNKLQMNQMLSEKASVESVNSKVDDTEVADVIKNIEFKDRGDEGVEMVVLKYDGMTVGVTLPTASNTTSGIITNKSFKDLVKQNQLQGVYSEMYDKLSEIRQQYQRKLKAGKNIQIDENNTIHAVGEISLDWDDVYNKPDFDKLFATVALAIQSESTRAKNAEQQLSARITDHVDVVEGKLELKADANSVYTKDQIDEKISGIYKIKGSRTFQDLPTSGNSIGDVYNITNNFALDGVEYPLGTNVVYTATGWDALAGIFDSTEIENKVDEIDAKVEEEVIRAKEKELELDKKFDDYLPLSGGTVKGAGYNILTVESSSANAAIRLKGTSASHGGYLIYGGNSNWIFSDDGWKIDNIALHSNNYSNYALPLTGGKLSNEVSYQLPILQLNATNSINKGLLTFNRQDEPIASFGADDDYGVWILNLNNPNIFKITKNTILYGNNNIYHEGNFNPGNYLPLSGGKIKSSKDGPVVEFINDSYLPYVLFTRNDNYYRIGMLGNALVCNRTNSSAWNKIWHEGNDGEGSGLDADTLDGKHASDFYDLTGGVFIPRDADLNDYTTAGTYRCTYNDIAVTILNSPTTDAFVLYVYYPNGVADYCQKQEIVNWINYKRWTRRHLTGADEWSDWQLTQDNLNTYNAPTATKATQDSEGNVITDTYALKSDLIIGLNITDGVYAVKADGSLCIIDEADTSCTGVALIAGEHKFMIAKSNATDGTNTTLYWGKNLYQKDVAGITNISSGEGYIGEGKKYGTDFTTWSTGPVVDFNGAANTAAIIAGYTEYGVSMDARDMCTVLNTFNTSDSYNDWYVPACGQLALMYLNVTEINAALAKIGGTALSAEGYLSSSEYSSSKAWYVYFYNGSVDNYNKSYYRLVRFIRDIEIESPKSVKESITEIKDQLKQPAESALKLATPVYLWGNNFDGSNNIISASIELWNNVGNYLGTWARNISAKDHLGKIIGEIGFCGTGNELNSAYIGNYHNLQWLTVKRNGNIGIGTTDPQYKLDVNGTSRFGSITVHNNSPLNWITSDGLVKTAMHLSNRNELIIGYGTSASEYNTHILGNELYFLHGTSANVGMILNSSGNITIGGSDLATDKYKLHVLGKMYLNEYGSMGNKPGPYLHINKSGYPFAIGTSLSSDTISFGYATDNSWINETITISNTGNCVGINNNDPKYALDVKGNVAFSGSLRAVSIYCTGIESGDLVDWYGVSWSENDSNPTCTRIGNMALHRSLPILSAMKRYSITNRSASIPEVIRELTDDGMLKYGVSNNNTHPIETGDFEQNIMVKIPEFWYTDDYEPSTKTHNLKISQTAKAGWIHHKEAYIGSYEGYNAWSVYTSTKNVIPTVSVSRETLRPLARANGYEDEYKWNIYTYEEHRAICHLFLVEYATRNSQAPVNTALTSDGFKQGGLGSGCTSGDVTINGATAYSFIPTGTTDSLGNGSGQVAYTVTLTDADGNETGTVTRYANRYRGIENPFGHIWKHVDDIVNVYNAKTTYKTVYKCNKPEHFATNKNAKYKPLCSFPGGSKMQGWSKEIKATINCDFFKYSVGGSETTYWCDYNYDNDDTSEHCLMIGGCSDNGVGAGLFRFDLDYSVGHSAVSIGSRLTYLPWAE